MSAWIEREITVDPDANFVFITNDLETRAEVLQWYIDHKAGGIAHTDEEINKVKILLENEKK